jgi:hypothetical protein
VNQKVIYFPRISPPDNEWFTRVLLYWDEVGTIVPMNGRERVLNDHARRLIDAGLVTPIAPAPHIHAIPRFSEAFLELVSRDDLVRPAPAADAEPARLTKIHMQKFGEDLAEALIAQGLARTPDDPTLYGWLDVEQRTAHLFMTYLASVLGHLKEIDMAPVTDVEAHLKLLAGPAPNAELAEQAALKIAVLSRALPAPSGGVTPEEIAEFKRDHAEQLVDFRIEVTRRALEATAAAPAARQELAETYGAELGRMADELAASMERRRWPRIGRGALAGLGGALATADAVATGGLLTQATAATGLVAAAWGAIDTRDAAPVTTDAVAYAAIAARELGR